MTNKDFRNLLHNDGDYVFLHNSNMDITGGKITKEDIDKIREHDNIEKVKITGLRQNTFEYFINKYGKKIKHLKLYKNKMIEDLTPLSELSDIFYIDIYHNQKAVQLWNMEKNYNLETLCLNDFSKIHSLEGIQTAPNLKNLLFGDMIWSKNKIMDLEPLKNTKLISFCFSGKSIINHDISVYGQMTELKHLCLDFYPEKVKKEILEKYPYLS